MVSAIPHISWRTNLGVWARQRVNHITRHHATQFDRPADTSYLRAISPERSPRLLCAEHCTTEDESLRRSWRLVSDVRTLDDQPQEAVQLGHKVGRGTDYRTVIH
jgi:hypothetical protein